jgi:hypothetical protein
MKFWFVCFALATLASSCVSIPAKAPADGSVICVFPQPGGSSFCQAATNLTAKEVTNQMSLCTSMQGAVVTACPAGAVGCCATTSGSVDFEQCFYDVSAATEESTCASKSGTWTAGSETSDAAATD